MSDNGKSGNGDGRKSNDMLVDLTLRQMEETHRVSELSDLSLALEIRQSGLTDDSRIYELLTRLCPTWLDEADDSDGSNPTHIALTIPIAVAYDELAYGHCRCRGAEAPSDDKTTPCIYCACKESLYRATKNPELRSKPRPA